MNRGAAVRPEGRGAKVIGMDELKQARERRASSARRAAAGQEEQAAAFRTQYEAWREERDDRPFWERDDPFVSDGYEPRGRTGAEPERELGFARRAWNEYNDEEYTQERPMKKNERTQSARGGARGRRQEEVRARPEGRREGAEPPRRRYEDRFNTQEVARQHVRGQEASKSRAGLYMLLLLLGLIALAVVIGLKVFEVTAIEVTGNDTMTADSVIALSGITKGENIFKVNLGQTKKNLESDPLVEVLSIERIFPDKIRIDIRLRKPHGAVAYLGTYAVIDETGFALDVRPDLPAGQYPLITGVEIEPPAKGKPITGLESPVTQVMGKLLTALYDNKAISCVSEADLSQLENIRLLTAEGLRIEIGKPTDLEKKAQWIACSVPELRSKGFTTGVLYVTGAGSPVYSGSGSGGQQQNEGNQQGQ